MTVFTLAQLLGIDVVWRNDLQDAGAWYPGENLIALREGLSGVETRSVLAHEIGHAVLGHVCNDFRAEREADAWAANMLLSAPVVAACAARWPESPEKWCDELQVTPDILRAWMAQPDNYARASQRLAA